VRRNAKGEGNGRERERALCVWRERERYLFDLKEEMSERRERVGGFEFC
jgi:hypothetical protein